MQNLQMYLAKRGCPLSGMRAIGRQLSTTQLFAHSPQWNGGPNGGWGGVKLVG